MSRERFNNLSLHTSGSRKTFIGSSEVGNITQDHMYEYQNWSCFDSVSLSYPYPDHNLDIQKGEMSPIYLDGSAQTGSFKYIYHNYRLPLFAASQCGQTPSSLMSWGELKTQALANANPNSPLVDIPLFLFELKDIPRMIRQAGDVLMRRTRSRDLPSLYLGGEFGWKPLLSDLFNLTKLGQFIDDRLRYIDGLSNEGNQFNRALRRNTVKGSPSVHTEPVGTFTIKSSSTTKAWYSLKVAADKTYRPEDPRWEAIRSSLGLRLSGQTLWDMLPWSWMVDWFGNVGQVLQANRTGIPFTPTKLCLMQKTEFTHVFTALANSGISVTPPTMFGVAKRRRVYSNPTATVRFRLPTFTGRQIGILTALGLGFSFGRRL